MIVLAVLGLTAVLVGVFLAPTILMCADVLKIH